MANVHLVKDENIGGIQREYVEVNRKAKVGDYVRLIHVETEFIADERLINQINSDIADGHIRTLEPTDIVHIDDKKYQLVKRNAEVGEKVLTIQYDGGCTKPGDIQTVLDLCGYTDGSVKTVEGSFFDRDCNDQYRVLIPVYSCDNCGSRLGESACSNSKGGSYCSAKCADEAEPTPDIHDLFANLAQRVTSLERINGELVRTKFSVENRFDSVESQLNDAIRNIERQAQELEREKEKLSDLKDEVESNTKDPFAFLDDRTFEKPGKPTKSAEVILRDISKLLERGLL